MTKILVVRFVLLLILTRLWLGYGNCLCVGFVNFGEGEKLQVRHLKQLAGYSLLGTF